MRYLRSAPWLACAWLFFLLALSVESSIILLELVFEHRLYLPAALLIPGLLVPVFARVHDPRAVATCGLVVLGMAALCGWQTIERNRAWTSPAALWAGDLERGASAHRAGLNSAIGYLRSGDPARALAMLERAGAATGVKAAKVHQIRGEALFALGRWEEALDAHLQALERAPRWARAAHFVGRCQLQLGRRAEAEDILAQMQDRDPDSIFTVSLAAELTARKGDRAQAIAMLDERLANSRSLEAVNRSFIQMQRGNFLHADGRNDAAVKAYRDAAQWHPNNWAAWSSLYSVLYTSGREDEAIEVRRYLRARGIDPAQWGRQRTPESPSPESAGGFR